MNTTKNGSDDCHYLDDPRKLVKRLANEFQLQYIPFVSRSYLTYNPVTNHLTGHPSSAQVQVQKVLPFFESSSIISSKPPPEKKQHTKPQDWPTWGLSAPRRSPKSWPSYCLKSPSSPGGPKLVVEPNPLEKIGFSSNIAGSLGYYCSSRLTTSWVVSTHLENISRNGFIFPNFRGEKQKLFETTT